MDVCEDDLGFDYEMEINEDDDGKVAKFYSCEVVSRIFKLFI